MNKLLDWLSRNGQYKIAIAVLLPGFLLQALLIGKYLPEFLSFSGGIKNPDQLFAYDWAFLTHLYQTLGAEGRRLYAEMLGVDFLYTLLANTGYALLLAALVSKRTWYIILPLVVMLSDILENIAQLILMNRFPNINAVGVGLSSFFSTAKMVLSLICVVLILFFVVKRLAKFIFR
jgi:hypothetical protein